MTLRDLLESGVQIQGDHIIIKEISNVGILFGTPAVYETEYNLYEGDIDEKYLNEEVKYIYQQNDSLVIEVGLAD